MVLVTSTASMALPALEPGHLMTAISVTDRHGATYDYTSAPHSFRPCGWSWPRDRAHAACANQQQDPERAALMCS